MKANCLLEHAALSVIIKEARKQKLPLFLVGGVVRARLRTPEAEIENADLLLVGNVQEFAEITARKLNSKAISINPRFNTVLIPTKDLEFEISGLRELVHYTSTSPGLPSEPILRDLFLRDFTINAIAEPLAPKYARLLDPCGGAEDLKNRLLRTPIAADITLQEDPLRIMRAARFASQLNFALDNSLLRGMHEYRQQLSGVSTERKTAELLKILQTPKPSIGLKLLYVTGVLEVTYPEIAALDLRQDRHPRHKDIFEHTLKVVDSVAQAGGDLDTRLAALLHDIGKPATRRYDAEAGWTFYGHEALGERMVRRLGKSWKLASATTERIARMVRLHMRPINLTDEGVTDSAVRRLGVLAGEDVDSLLTLCRADVTSSDPERVKRYLENFEHVVEHLKLVEDKDQLAKFQSPVRGEVIMSVAGLEPGPLVGKLKTMIEEAILEGVIPNEYDAALDYLLRIKDEILDQGGEKPERTTKKRGD